MSDYRIIKIEKCSHCVQGYNPAHLTEEQIKMLENGASLIPVTVGQLKASFVCPVCKGENELKREVDLIDALKKVKVKSRILGGGVEVYELDLSEVE